MKAVALLYLLGLACLAHAGQELARANLDATCLFQQRTEIQSSAPVQLGDQTSGGLRRSESSKKSGSATRAVLAVVGSGEQLRSAAVPMSAIGQTSNRTTVDILQSFYDGMDLPGWTNGDDTGRGIIRQERPITVDEMFNSPIFPSAFDSDIRHMAPEDGDEGWGFFKAAPVGAWIWLMVTCVLLCLLDLFVMSRLPDTFGWHLTAISIWIGVAACFNMLVLTIEGPQQAFQWATGYLLEWMLSMDNLFVFHLVFSAYQTPADQIHKAAFVGIMGAVVMRMLFFMVVSTLLGLFGWFRWPFGLLLVYSGIEAARGEDEDEDANPRDTRLVRGLTWLLGSRLQDTYDEGGRMITWDSEGRLRVTLLVVVIACLEFTDVLFALDSVSAKVAQIPDQFLAFSSSVLAMFGLRAMFFIIKDLVEMFELLQYGLCVILVFIGLELMFGRYVHLQSSTICCMIIAVFIICIVASKANQALGGRDRTASEWSEKEKKAIDAEEKLPAFANEASASPRSGPQPEEESEPAAIKARS